jgi:hypothetical protein
MALVKSNPFTLFGGLVYLPAQENISLLLPDLYKILTSPQLLHVLIHNEKNKWLLLSLFCIDEIA